MFIWIKQKTISLISLFINKQLCYIRQNKIFSINNEIDIISILWVIRYGILIVCLGHLFLCDLIPIPTITSRTKDGKKFILVPFGLSIYKILIKNGENKFKCYIGNSLTDNYNKILKLIDSAFTVLYLSS